MSAASCAEAASLAAWARPASRRKGNGVARPAARTSTELRRAGDGERGEFARGEQASEPRAARRAPRRLACLRHRLGLLVLLAAQPSLQARGAACSRRRSRRLANDEGRDESRGARQRSAGHSAQLAAGQESRRRPTSSSFSPLRPGMSLMSAAGAGCGWIRAGRRALRRPGRTCGHDRGRGAPSAASCACDTSSGAGGACHHGNAVAQLGVVGASSDDERVRRFPAFAPLVLSLKARLTFFLAL